MYKKTIYLHVGTHKTGTTTIQHFLFYNYEALKKQGFDYLIENSTWEAHHALGWSFQGIKAPIQYYCPWHEKGVINHLENEIKKSCSDTFIISSENMFQLKDMEFINNFFARFHKQYDIKIIIFLRDQVSFIESWYYELVRADYCKLSDDIDAFITNPRYNLDYYSEIKKWEKYIHKDSILVRNFSIEASNGKLLENFCTIIGLKFFNELVAIPNKNEKINPIQLKYLKKLNSENLPNSIWIQRRDEILNNYKNMPIHQVSLLNEDQKNNIRTQYFDSNKLLLERYGIDLLNLND